MRWFGGRAGGVNGPLPAGARVLHPNPMLWVAGSWQPEHVRTVTDRRGTVAVIGPCEATGADLVRLLHELPDSALTAWAGAYTIVRLWPTGLVTVLTDPANACPIYTVRAAGALVWGSSSRALASLAGSGVDVEWLGRSLADPTAPLPGRSAWAGVAMLPAGRRCTLHPDAPPRCVPAWKPRTLGFAHAARCLRETLTAAVRVRVGPARVAASDLSGGLDSTTLAALAATMGPVLGVTSHPAQVTGGGDLDYARMTAGAFPSMTHALLPLDESHLPYLDLAVPATDEPAPSTVSWAMLSAEFRLLAAAGVDCHLTGDGGDTLFLPPPLYLADLARRRRYLRVFREAQRWARLRRISPWPLLASAIAGRADRLRDTPGSPDWLGIRFDRVPDGLPAGLGHADRALLTEARFVARTAHAEAQLADTFGICLHNPYTDARVLDTLLAAPSWLRASPTRYKPLLSDATVGLLPPAVHARGAKGIFVGDHHQGLRAQLDPVMRLIDGQLASLGLIDPRKVRAVLRRAAAGLTTPWGSISALVAAEAWLRAIDAEPRIEWSTASRQPVAP